MAKSKGDLNDNIQVCIRKSQWKKALAELEKLYALDKGDPQVTLRMGDMCLKLGDKDNAAVNYLKTAGLFAKQGHVPKAVATYKMILRMDPSLTGVQDKIDALMSDASKPAPVLDKRNLKVDLSKAIPGLDEAAKGYPEPIPVKEPDNAPVYELEISAPTIPAESFGTIELSPASGDLVIETTDGETRAEEQFGSYGMTELASREAVEEALDPVPPPEPGPPAPASKSIPLLFDLSHEETWDLLGKMKRHNFGAGAAIVREGELGDSLYIIRKGGVRVVTKVGESEVVLANLGERDFFGEVSFLTGRPRTADIITNEPTEIMELSREDLEDVTKKHPKVAGVLRVFHESRVADTVTSLKAVAKNFLK